MSTHISDVIPDDYCWPDFTVKTGDHVQIEMRGLWSAVVETVVPHVSERTASLTVRFTGEIVPEWASVGIASPYLPHFSTWDGLGPKDIVGVRRGHRIPESDKEAMRLKEAVWMAKVAAHKEQKSAEKTGI
jgi:hypothetical protein